MYAAAPNPSAAPKPFDDLLDKSKLVELSGFALAALAHGLALVLIASQVVEPPNDEPRLISVSLLSAPFIKTDAQSLEPTQLLAPTLPPSPKPVQPESKRVVSEPVKANPEPVNPEPINPLPVIERSVTKTPPQPEPQQKAAESAEPKAEPPLLDAPTGQVAPLADSLVLPMAEASHLNNPKPLYPRISRRMGEEGTVLLKVLILSTGRVGQAEIQQSSGHSRLDESALHTVRDWVFVPARRGGEPIDYWHVQPVSFKLNG